MFVPTEINIGQMKVNNADHAGRITLGSSVQSNRNVTAKKTQGFGQQLADGTVRFMIIQAVWDDDASDEASAKRNGI